jgi:hypothetical protein
MVRLLNDRSRAIKGSFLARKSTGLSIFGLVIEGHSQNQKEVDHLRTGNVLFSNVGMTNKLIVLVTDKKTKTMNLNINQNQRKKLQAHHHLLHQRPSTLPKFQLIW